MNRKMMILPLLLGLGASPLYAAPGHGKWQHNDHGVVVKAKVTHVDPIIEVAQIPRERRECWDEEVSGSQVHRSGGGLLAGAIIGGVIGHNIGNSRNRGATTAVGTLIGATIGHEQDHDYTTPYGYTEQRCRVSTDYIEEQRTLGYRVSYQYQGEVYTTRMARDPGHYVRLRVTHQLLD